MRETGYFLTNRGREVFEGNPHRCELSKPARCPLGPFMLASSMVRRKPVRRRGEHASPASR